MDRRQFIQLIAGLGLAQMVPSEPLFPTGEVISGDITVDTVAKTISISPDAGSYRVLELHQHLAELFDSPALMVEEAPTMRVTDCIVEVQSPWKLDASTVEHLYDGAIVQGNELYASVGG